MLASQVIEQTRALDKVSNPEASPILIPHPSQTQGPSPTPDLRLTQSPRLVPGPAVTAPILPAAIEPLPVIFTKLPTAAPEGVNGEQPGEQPPKVNDEQQKASL